MRKKLDPKDPENQTPGAAVYVYPAIELTTFQSRNADGQVVAQEVAVVFRDRIDGPPQCAFHFDDPDDAIAFADTMRDAARDVKEGRVL